MLQGCYLELSNSPLNNKGKGITIKEQEEKEVFPPQYLNLPTLEGHV